MEQQAKKNFLINFIFALIIGVIIFISGRFLFQYLFPFVIAWIIAWAVQKPSEFVSNKIKVKKSLCAAVISVVLFLGFAFVLFFAVYQITMAIKNMIFDLPDILAVFENFINNLKNSFSSLLGGISKELVNELNVIAEDMLTNVRQRLTSAFSGAAASFAGKLPSFLFSSVVTLVAGCYIAKDFEKLSRFLRELLGKKVFGNIIKVKEIFVNSVFKLIKGYLIIMFITFLELWICFMLAGIRYAPLIALLVSLIDLLPVFGTGTALIPWSVAEFLSGDNKLGLGLLFIYIAVTVVRNFLEPKIIGGQIGINPLFTLIAMFAGLKLLGFWGLFILPITFIVVVKYYKNEMELENKKITVNKGEY